MNETFEFVNKVANSGLVTVDLQKIVGDVKIMEFDIKDFLFMELILKEKDFREALDNHHWEQYDRAVLAVHCSTDAIIASWAYMLITSKATGYARSVEFGSREVVLEKIYAESLKQHDWSQYSDKKVLVKGCSDQDFPQSAYLYATDRLMSYAERVMYGEACSFVPVWRRPKSI